MAKLKEFITLLARFDPEADVFIDVGDEYVAPHTISYGSLIYQGDDAVEASQQERLFYPSTVVIHVDGHDE